MGTNFCKLKVPSSELSFVKRKMMWSIQDDLIATTTNKAKLKYNRKFKLNHMEYAKEDPAAINQVCTKTGSK